MSFDVWKLFVELAITKAIWRQVANNRFFSRPIFPITPLPWDNTDLHVVRMQSVTTGLFSISHIWWPLPDIFDSKSGNLRLSAADKKQGRLENIYLQGFSTNLHETNVCCSFEHSFPWWKLNYRLDLTSNGFHFRKAAPLYICVAWHLVDLKRHQEKKHRGFVRSAASFCLG